MIEWLNDTNVELVPNDFKSFPIIIDNNKAIIIDSMIPMLNLYQMTLSLSR